MGAKWGGELLIRSLRRLHRCSGCDFYRLVCARDFEGIMAKWKLPRISLQTHHAHEASRGDCQRIRCDAVRQNRLATALPRRPESGRRDHHLRPR
jgi:hypothetical protein